MSSLITKLLSTTGGVVAAETDPDFANVSLLLHGDGTNGAQNNTFLDSSANGFTITRNGNTTQGSYSPYGDRWSNYFDGTGDYLTVGSASDWNFLHNGSPWTIQFSANPEVTSAYTIMSTGISTVDFGMSFRINQFSIGELRLVVAKGTSGSYAVDIRVSNFVLVNQWANYAISFDGVDTYNFYRNGSLIDTSTVSTTYSTSNATDPLHISSWSDQGSAGDFFTGYLSDVRISDTVISGLTTNPTAPLEATADTVLLTCQSNRFIDNSSNGFAITANGNTKVTPFSPYAPSDAYDPANEGGSGYFDGSSTTGLDVATGQLSANGAYTMEGWFYINSFTNQNQIFASSGASGNYCIIQTTGELEFFYTSTSKLEMGASTLALNEWHHFAFVRDASNNIALFVDGVRYDSNTVSGTLDIVGSGGNAAIGYSPSIAGRNVNGYISDFRIVNGTAIYDPTQTTLTVPTAPLTAVTNTSLLCNFTNAGIFDSTGKNVIETVGNAQIDTAVTKFGAGSMKFDGTGDELRVPASPEFEFGTGDFTIEFWVYYPTTPGVEVLIDWRNTSGTQGTQYITLYNDAAVLRFFKNSNVLSATISVGQWQHVSLCRSGTSTRLFLDGVQQGSTLTDSQDYSGPQGDFLYIGGLNGNFHLNGYLDDFRITKGVARYTTNFTPPTKAFPDQ